VNVQEPQTPIGYCQPLEKTSHDAVSSPSAAAIASVPHADDLVDDLDNYVPIANTQLLPPLPSPQKPRQWLLPTLLGISLLLSAGGLWLALSKRQPQSAVNRNPEQIAPSGSPVAPGSITTTANPERSLGIFIAQQQATLKRQEQSANSSTDVLQLSSTDFTLPKGSIVKVLGEPRAVSGQHWRQLQVCSNPTLSPSSNPSSTTDRRIKPGESAWIATADLETEFQQISAGDSPCPTAKSSPKAGMATEEAEGTEEQRETDRAPLTTPPSPQPLAPK
jgi:protein phosphatase